MPIFFFLLSSKRLILALFRISVSHLISRFKNIHKELQDTPFKILDIFQIPEKTR